MNPNPDSPTRGSHRSRRIMAGLALATAVAAGGAGIAQAAAQSGGAASVQTVQATNEPTTTVATTTDDATTDNNVAPNDAATGDRPTRPDNGETEVTGADADSASAAALNAVPGGTVKRVTTDTDDGGAFEVHMSDADGNRVKVILDANFTVIETKTGGPGGAGGPGGTGGHANGETEVTGADADSASAAALEAVPGGTVKRVTTDTDDGGAFEVHMSDADGNRVKVILDANFTVIETKTGGPGGAGGRGGRDGGATDATDDAAATDSPATDASINTGTSGALSA